MTRRRGGRCGGWGAEIGDDDRIEVDRPTGRVCDHNRISSLGKLCRNPLIRAVRLVEVEVQAADVNSNGAETRTALKCQADLLPREPEGDGGAGCARHMQSTLVRGNLGNDVPADIGDQGM